MQLVSSTTTNTAAGSASFLGVRLGSQEAALLLFQPSYNGAFMEMSTAAKICQLLGNPLGITRSSATIFSTESQGSVHGNVRLLLCQPSHTGTFVSGRLCMQLVPRWAAEKDIATSFKHVWAVAEAIGLGNRLDERFHRCFCEECVWARAVHSSIWLVQAGSSYFR